MSYQVGDMAQFAVNTVSVEGTNVAAYVWRFWDAAIQVGTTGTTFKRINIGGDPSNGNQLIYCCTPVLEDGSSVNLYGTITANNPPYLAPSPSATKNDDYYGYQTTLSVKYYAIDGHTPITPSWWEGATLLGAGVSVPTAPTTHTWRGNDTSYTAAYATVQNSYTTNVHYDRVITFSGTDTAGGITRVDFRLRGKPVPPLGGVLVADGNSVTTDATSQPRQRIGPGQTVTFVAYVTDIDGLVPTFQWQLLGTPPGNWTVPYIGGGATATLPDGSFSNTLVKSVASEVVSSGTVKVCVATCRITGNPGSRSAGQSATLQFTVELVKNNPPTNTVVTCQKQSDMSTVNMATDTVPAGTILIYSAVSQDLDLDVVHQDWWVDNFPEPWMFPMYASGPKIIVDTGSYAPGVKVQGHVRSTDRMGGVYGPIGWTGPEIS